MNQYKQFAYIYDLLMDDVDYEKWIHYIEEIIKKENVSVKNILELASGTGNITLPLAKKGYDILGVDISFEMLDVARQKSENQNIDVVFLNQDITKLDFDVYNLDCVLCACDGINYIIDEDNVKNIFIKVYELLKNNGIFIFDISSYYKLSNILSDNTFVEHREDITYIWENYFDEDQSLIDMDMTFFVKEGKLYEKFEELHTQRAYKIEEITDLLKESGFNYIKTYGDFTFEEENQESERIFVICKK